MTDVEQYEYDVALSFAGEDRDYVRGVAVELERAKIRVFFDEFNEEKLWGANLAEHFDDVFRNKARHCVVFISKAYTDKAWPNFEKRSVLSRSVIQKDYIWPARFDEVDILGIAPTIGYIDLKNKRPQEFAQIIINKLRGKSAEKNNDEIQKITSYRKPRKKVQFDPYGIAQDWVEFLVQELSKRKQKIGEAGYLLSAFKRESAACIRLLKDNDTVFSIDCKIGGMFGDRGMSFSFAYGELRNSGVNGWGEFEWNDQRGEAILKLTDFGGTLSKGEPQISKEQLLERIWDMVCDQIDQNKK